MPSRPFALLLAAFVALGTQGCGGNTLKSADDASRYIDEILGGSETGIKLADDASPVARAAWEDAEPLSDLQRSIDARLEGACDVVGLVNAAAHASPESVEPVMLDKIEQGVIRLEAFDSEISEDTTDSVLNAALDMAQSTWVQAADSACNVAEL